MPIVIDASGRTKYVSLESLYADVLADFFHGNEARYRKLIVEGRRRSLEAIRFASRPLCGRGLNLEVRGVGPAIENLVTFIDDKDSKRSNRLHKQRHREKASGLIPGEARLRSPQDIKRRRRALFNPDDIPSDYLKRYKLTTSERARFLERMRKMVIEAAVKEMHDRREIECINDTWYVKVSVMDKHTATRQCRRGGKHDVRPFHGRPNRDRTRPVGIAS